MSKSLMPETGAFILTEEDTSWQRGIGGGLSFKRIVMAWKVDEFIKPLFKMFLH